MALLDVILGYDCNLACDYCTITQAMRAKALEARAVLRALREGRALGYDAVSFTGGEPTIRPDLVPLVRAAKKLGYTSIKVQSNGLVYAEASNVDRLVAAGVTLFHVSVHTHQEPHYERLVRRAGTHTLLVRGLDHLVARGLAVNVDLIMKEDTYRELPAALEWVAGLGIESVHLWLVSLTDGNRDNIASLPTMTALLPSVVEAFRVGEERGVRVRSLHLPRCLLGEHADKAFDPGSERVRVVTPEATFELSESRITPNTHVDACEGCEHRDVCPGVRADYLEVHGDREIAAARGVAGTLSPVRFLPTA